MIKKIASTFLFFIFSIALCFYYFASHIGFYLEPKEVGGYEYTTFTFDEYFIGNGFSFWNLGETYRLSLGDNKHPTEWRHCSKLTTYLTRRLENYSTTWDHQEQDIRFIGESN
jgi:hypothetical protein